MSRAQIARRRMTRTRARSDMSESRPDLTEDPGSQGRKVRVERRSARTDALTLRSPDARGEYSNARVAGLRRKSTFDARRKAGALDFGHHGRIVDAGKGLDVDEAEPARALWSTIEYVPPGRSAMNTARFALSRSIFITRS